FVHHPLTTSISTLSLHDALPIYRAQPRRRSRVSQHAYGEQRVGSTGLVSVRPSRASSATSSAVRTYPTPGSVTERAKTTPYTSPSGVSSGPPELPDRTYDRIA